MYGGREMGMDVGDVTVTDMLVLQGWSEQKMLGKDLNTGNKKKDICKRYTKV